MKSFWNQAIRAICGTPRRRPVRKTRLSVESLEGRWCPANNFGDPDPPPDGGSTSSIYLTTNNTVAVIEGSTLNDKGEVSLSGSSLLLKIGHYTSGGAYILDMQATFPQSLIKQVVFLGRNGNDTFINGTATESKAYGEHGNDTLRGGSGIDRLYGDAWDGSGSGTSADLLYGYGGNDFLSGGIGNDAVYGGDGNDVILGADGADVLAGESGLDWVYGAAGNDTLYGGAGNDYLFGETGADALYGDAGYDYLDGGYDNTIDQMTGGADKDYFISHAFNSAGVSFPQSETLVDVTASQNDLSQSHLHESEVADSRPRMAAVLENGSLTVYGTYAGDTISATSTTVGRGIAYHRVTLNGWSLLYAESSIATGAFRFFGGAGNDTISNATAQRMVAWGEDGDDTITGGGGNDTVYGAAGNDSLSGGGADDLLAGFEDNDTLRGGSGNDRLYGGTGADFAYGDGGNDAIYGEGERDKLYGGTGTDTLSGGDGDDWLDAGAAGETVVGDGGINFDAYGWAVNGTSIDDVYQEGSSTCWLLSSLSSTALRGENLSGRINYLGNDTYSIGLFVGGSLVQQQVTFDGTLVGADPEPHGTAANGTLESWVILYQRAILSRMGLSLTDPPGGQPEHALDYLTGRSSEHDRIGWNYWVYFGSATASLERMRNAISEGKNAVVCTRSDPTDPLIVGDHCYAVVGVSYNDATGQYSIALYNPHGRDRKNGYTEDGNNDGFICLSQDRFGDWFDEAVIN